MDHKKRKRVDLDTKVFAEMILESLILLTDFKYHLSKNLGVEVDSFPFFVIHHSVSSRPLDNFLINRDMLTVGK